MNELEATRAKLKCLEMVDGTSLKWWKVITVEGFTESFNAPPEFNLGSSEYVIALGIVEGKPVWEGDKLFFNSGGYFEINPTMISAANVPLAKGCWSWHPPKPKTVMIELLLNDAIDFKAWNSECRTPLSTRLSDACRKALEELK